MKLQASYNVTDILIEKSCNAFLYHLKLFNSGICWDWMNATRSYDWVDTYDTLRASQWNLFYPASAFAYVIRWNFAECFCNQVQETGDWESFADVIYLLQYLRAIHISRPPGCHLHCYEACGNEAAATHLNLDKMLCFIYWFSIRVSRDEYVGVMYTSMQALRGVGAWVAVSQTKHTAIKHK